MSVRTVLLAWTSSQSRLCATAFFGDPRTIVLMIPATLKQTKVDEFSDRVVAYTRSESRGRRLTFGANAK